MYMQQLRGLKARGTVPEGAYVPAQATWRILLAFLRSEDFTKTELARRLGQQTRALPMTRPTMRRSRHVKIHRFIAALNAEVPE